MAKYFLITWFFIFSGITNYTISAQTQEASLPQEAQQAMAKGLEAAKLKDWDSAIKQFAQAQKLAPTSAQALFNLALANDQAGGRELAASALLQGVSFSG